MNAEQPGKHGPTGRQTQGPEAQPEPEAEEHSGPEPEEGSGPEPEEHSGPEPEERSGAEGERGFEGGEPEGTSTTAGRRTTVRRGTTRGQRSVAGRRTIVDEETAEELPLTREQRAARQPSPPAADRPTAPERPGPGQPQETPHPQERPARPRHPQEPRHRTEPQGPPHPTARRPVAAPSTVTYWMEHAWLETHAEPGVAVDVRDGRIAAVHRGVAVPPPGAEVLRGLTLPGLANAHSHAFHRALRGTVQVGAGTFWTWREIMYSVADRLTPDSYHRLARAVYAEMALAGITAVGEFHYLHHAPGGAPYADANAMGEALLDAAAQAGIRITLLDAAYLSSGFGEPPDQHQQRFSDGSAEAWAERVSLLKDRAHARIGAAVHSVRAVPAEHLGTVAAWARTRGAPLHVHVSEQTAENDACRAAHGRTPVRLLADHGVLGPGTTGVHLTHLTGEDIRLVGDSRTGTCMCPTTERDLADGIGPAAALQQAGSALSLGTDSHAVIDLLEEARALELNERLRTRRRGHWTAAALLRAATADGHAALGWPDSGAIEPGRRADFATVALDSVRTAGPAPRLAAEAAVFAGTTADVRHTVVAGRQVVRDGAHLLVPEVPNALGTAIEALNS